MTCPEGREMRAYLDGCADAYELAMHETRNRAIGHADDRWVPMMQLADYFEHRASSTREGIEDLIHMTPDATHCRSCAADRLAGESA